MHLQKLTAVLKSLSADDLNRLADYVHSPYFKVPSAAVVLFNYLQKQHPEFYEKKMLPAVIAKKESGLPTENKQAKAGTELLKAVEHFLALEQWQLKINAHPLYLLEAQKQLKLNDAFEATAQKYAEQLQNCPEKNIDYFNYLHLATETEHSGFQARLQRNLKNDLSPITQTLDTFYAVKKLRYHCELLCRHQILGTPYSNQNMPELLQLLESFNTTGYPYVFLFVNIYHILKAATFNEGENYYRLLHQYIERANYTTLPEGVIEAIPYLINYCLYWNNQGYGQAGSDALYWYQLRIKHNRFIESGMLQPNDFRNIVSLAIISDKNEKWLKQFIDTYAPYLPREQAPTNLAFVQAQYFYYVKKYDKAMPLFQQAQAKDEPIFNMIVRRWQFICMYEQSPESKELLLDFLTTWERQLHRTAPALHQLKEVFGKVISYSKKLLAAASTKQKKEIATALEAEAFFAGKNWLLQQLKK